MTADAVPVGSTARCEDCDRSVWTCEGAGECAAFVGGRAALACTIESHQRAKLTRPSTLRYHALQIAEDGTVDYVSVLCPLCGSHLAISPDEWIKSAVHPPRLEVVR